MVFDLSPARESQSMSSLRCEARPAGARVNSAARPPLANDSPTQDTATVGVVVLNFNTGQLLQECVAAVLNSDHPVQLVVVDNASTDASINDLVESLPPSKNGYEVVRNPKNWGFARGNNAVLPLLTNVDRILILNPDCIVRPDTIGLVTDALVNRPTAGLAGCRIKNVDGTEQSSSYRSLPNIGSSIATALGRAAELPELPPGDSPVEVEAISGSFMMVTRAALDAVGPLDERYFLHCEDLDWCTRLRDGGFAVIYCRKAEAVHHKGVGSRSRPYFAEYHKHLGMARYFATHLSKQASRPGRVLVWIGIPAHLGLSSARIFLRRLLDRVRS